MRPAIHEGNVAVVTGAASGIGLATSRRLVELGLRVCMVDANAERVQQKASQLREHTGSETIVSLRADVSKREDLVSVQSRVGDVFGGVDILMNNAVTRTGGGVWSDVADWQTAVDVNFWGVVHGTQVFGPAMISRNSPGLIINSGSKQGITNPPGNAAYNVTKSALKTYTEALQHDLRTTQECQVSAHLLIPGWTTTGDRDHQPGAWMPDQVVDYMFVALDRGDFYILCPDNEVSPDEDRKRVLWSARDVTENRPPLSRWHGDFDDTFDAFEG